MIHLLDKQSDKIVATLREELVDANHEEAIDLVELVDFESTINEKAGYISERNRVVIPGEDGIYRELILDRVEKTGGRVYGQASASYLDLEKQKIISPLTLNAQTLEGVAGDFLLGTEWQTGIVEWAGTSKVSFDEPLGAYTALKRLCTLYGMEMRFRVEISGNVIVGRYVDFYKRRGQFLGKEVTFGKDLIELRRIEDSSEIVTALKCYGPEKEDGSRLILDVVDEEALQRWGRDGKHLWGIYEPETEEQNMTEARLRTLGRTELDKRINSIVQYETTQAALDTVQGMAHEKVVIADTVRIKDTHYRPPLYMEARVRRVQRSLLDGSKKEYTLGDFIEYKEEDLRARFKGLQKLYKDRLAKLVIPSITASAGTVFKNGVGSTDLTAVLTLNGQEIDIEGTSHEYEWIKYDRNGIIVLGWVKTGKTITVTAEEIVEKAIFMVHVVSENVDVVAQETITSIFDGLPGADGTDGKDGTGISSITVTYQNHTSGSTAPTGTWTSTIPAPIKGRYLWTRTVTSYTDGSSVTTYSVAYTATDGQNGTDGKGISSTAVNYQIGASGTAVPSGAWTTSIPAPVKGSYLWTRTVVTYTDGTSSTSYSTSYYATDGQKGDKGDTGGVGPQGIPGVPGADGKTLYTWVKYADSPTSGMSDSPDGKKYIGLAYNKDSATQSLAYSDYKWSLIQKEGIQGPPGKDGAPTYTWIKYADTDKGAGMSDSSDGKRFLGIANNKTTATESNNPADYTWSPLYDNVQVGGRNLLVKSLIDYIPSSSSGTGMISEIVTDELYGDVLHTNKQYVHGTELYVPRGSFKVGDKITMSLLVKAITKSKLTAQLYNTATVSGMFSFDVETTWKWVTFTQTIVGNPDIDSRLYIYASGSEYWISKIMIEKGNIATDWTPAPEDVAADAQAKADAAEAAAKAEALKAQQSADSKSTIYRQATQPSTVGKKEGDLWFDTSKGNRMSVFQKGVWTFNPLDHLALVIGKLSAISADLGDVTAGNIRGVTLDLGNGKLVVDALGNASFAGELKGARGVFRGSIETPILDISNPNIEQEGGMALRMQTAKWQADINKPFYKTGYIEFNTLNDALEILAYGLDGKQRMLDGFIVQARKTLFAGTVGFVDASGAQFDKYGNIEAPAGASPNAYWNIKDNFGNVVFKVPWGDNRENLDTTNLSLRNGWTNYGGVYQTAKARKDPAGYVHLEGMIKGGIGEITTLPAKYRPQSGIALSVTGNNGSDIMTRINIGADGIIKHLGSNVSWLSLADIPPFFAGW